MFVTQRNATTTRQVQQGYILLMLGRGCHYWVATWRTLEGDRKTRNFSIKKLGNEEALAQAISHRQAKFLEIKTQAGYTERHGKEANEH